LLLHKAFPCLRFKFYVKKAMSRLLEAENRLEQVLQRLEAAADRVAGAGASCRAELQTVTTERDEIKARAGDLAQRLEKAVARLKVVARETV